MYTMWLFILAVIILFLGGIFCALCDISDIGNDVESRGNNEH